jgi:hypothetical protein
MSVTPAPTSAPGRPTPARRRAPPPIAATSRTSTSARTGGAVPEAGYPMSESGPLSPDRAQGWLVRPQPQHARQERMA